MKRISFTRDGQLTAGWFWLFAAVLTLGRLAAAAFQMGYYTPDLAPLDDTLLYDMAVSITQGSWLGEYGWLTLSKHSFFALWLAALHLLHIPFLVGGQALWAAGCAALACAFAPVLPTRGRRLALYGVLLWNPAAIAAFTLRVYRDNIFPALCLLVFAGMAGFALRCTRQKAVGWLVLCGLSLGAVWLCREDGVWVWPFVLAAGGIVVWRICASRLPRRTKAGRAALLAIVPALFGLCLCGWAGMNAAAYGRFVVSDFTSSDFTSAYGALTRVQAGQDEQDGLIQIPLTRAGREALYEAGAEHFTLLRPWLEDPAFQNGYADVRTGEYPAGAFYWALRRAASEAGMYETAQTAQEYFTALADEVNALCDSGAVEATGPRSSTTPRITAKYVGPVVREGLHSLWFCLTMQDAAPCMDTISVGRAEDQIAPMEAFLHTPANLACKAGTSEPYYSPLQTLVFGVLQGVRHAYSLLLPLCLLLAVVRLCAGGRSVWKKGVSVGARVAWLAVWGLLGMAVLRAMMIAFMEVASFGIGTSIMYLSTVHPLLIAAAALGLLAFWKQLAEQRD